MSDNERWFCNWNLELVGIQTNIHFIHQEQGPERGHSHVMDNAGTKTRPLFMGDKLSWWFISPHSRWFWKGNHALFPSQFPVWSRAGKACAVKEQGASDVFRFTFGLINLYQFDLENWILSICLGLFKFPTQKEFLRLKDKNIASHFDAHKNNLEKFAIYKFSGG